MVKVLTFKTLLLIFLTVSITGLAVITWRLQKNEAIVLAHQKQNFIRSQLGSAESSVTVYLHQLQSQLLVDAAGFMGDESQVELNVRIKDYLRKSPLVGYIRIANGNGDVLYPLENMSTNSENEYIENTYEIWKNKELFISAPRDSQSGSSDTNSRNYFSSYSSNSRSQERVVTSLVAESVSGWLTWHKGNEKRYIFWVRDQADRLVSFDLLVARVLSDIIARLPDESESSLLSIQGSLRLVDEKMNNIYQWGQFSFPDNLQPLGFLYLEEPFNGWRLEYFQEHQSAVGSWVQSLFVFSIFVFAIIGLVVYLYKIQQRELKEAEQRVSFVNRVSHELKTPLTNVRMYAELLETELMDDDVKAKSYLHVIVDESKRLSRLIENVLNFSRAQKNKLTVTRKLAVIDDCIQQCLDAFKASFQQKKVIVEFQSQVEKAVYFDHQALEQILNNLLSNAEKYAQDGKKIDITSTLKADRVRISIRDFGTGIPLNLQNLIFEPFYRVQTKVTEGVSGTGIGLSISRELAREHGGDITLLDVDVGSCFIVELDVSQHQGRGSV